MNDIRRTILWVIFGFSLVMLWDQWQLANGGKPMFLPAPKASVSASAPATGASAAAGLPAAAGSGAATTSSSAVPTEGAAAAPSGEKVTVSTDVFKAVIDGQGATLSNLQLLQYDEQSHQDGLVELFYRMIGRPEPKPVTSFVTLMEDGSPATRYVAQTGLLNTVDTGEHFPNHLSLMSVKSGPREMAPGQNTLDVVFESQPAGGLKYVKTYQFKRGDY